MLIKAKRLDNLELKVSSYKNRVVVNYLNSKGYKCDGSKISMVKVNNLLKSKGQRVVITKEDERISRLGSYYTWEAKIKVKIIDTITMEEV